MKTLINDRYCTSWVNSWTYINLHIYHLPLPVNLYEVIKELKKLLHLTNINQQIFLFWFKEYSMLRYGFHRKDTLIKEPVQTHALIQSSEVCAYLIQSYYNQLVIILLINLKMFLIFW